MYYEFSVYEIHNIIGRIYIGANKTLGQSVQLVSFGPNPYKAAEAMTKSLEIAKEKYPAGEIKSTNMVVYDYPEIVAMTVVTDKTTGEEYRIFVDAYTLDVIPDRSATETESGVSSVYNEISKNEINDNLKNWQKSDEFTKSIEQAAINQGVNIDSPVTKKDINKLSKDTTIMSKNVEKNLNTTVTKENIKKLSKDKPMTATTVQKDLSVTIYLQKKGYYCQPASAQMLTKYYNGVKPSQDSIYKIMLGKAPNGVNNTEALIYLGVTQLAFHISFLTTLKVSELI